MLEWGLFGPYGDESGVVAATWSLNPTVDRPRSSRTAHLLLDSLLPAYDARERHTIVIRAPAERVYAALWSANLTSPLVRLLLGLRALPGATLRAFSQPRDAWGRLRGRMGARVTMRDVVAGGFTVVAEDPPRELVLGVDGAFWRLRGDLRRVGSFGEPQPPGTARAAWNFHLAKRPDGSCELSTETRVRCADAVSRRRFRLYWLVVRPGSGLIRRMMLRSIRRAAEREA